MNPALLKSVHTRHRPAGPACKTSALLRGFLLWLVVIFLAAADLSLRALFSTTRQILQLAFKVLVYLVLATLFLCACILVLGVQVLDCNNGKIS